MMPLSRITTDVQFQCCLITARADNLMTGVTRSVLQRVVELCVTVRGFAFAKSCIELYKQTHFTQRSKA